MYCIKQHKFYLTSKSKTMNLYLLYQDINDDYDTYDQVIVAAESEEEARQIHPIGFVTHIKDGKWYGTRQNGEEYEFYSSVWVCASEIDRIDVELIGTTHKKKGVVLASFNAR